MNLAQLKQRLEQEGINPGLYALGTRSYDGVCLLQTAAGWAVCYSERGCDEAPLFVGDEAAACQYYYQFVLRQRYHCCVASCESAAEAQLLLATLRQHGIAAEVSRTRYAADAWRHEVCVMPPDGVAARLLLRPLPESLAEPPAPEGVAQSWWQQLGRWLGMSR